jgi:ATP synthase F1 complex assembly factor 1
MLRFVTRGTIRSFLSQNGKKNQGIIFKLTQKKKTTTSLGFSATSSQNRSLFTSFKTRESDPLLKDNKNEKDTKDPFKDKPVAKEELARVTRTLDEICDVNQLQQESKDKIVEIWKAFHISKHCVFATIDAATWTKLSGRMKEFPMFILPLPKGKGVEFMLVQHQGDTSLFTALAEFKEKGVQAKPALKLKHYAELQHTKDIVLMRGELDPERVTLLEAQLLANQLQLHYLDPPRLKHVETFNRRPNEFDYNVLLDQISVSELNQQGEKKAEDNNNNNTNENKSS